MVVLALAVRPERRGVARDRLVDLLVGDVALTPVDMKRARLEAQALRAIRQGTEWLTAAEIADLAGLGPANPIATVGRWKQQGLARAEVIDSDPVHFPVTRQLSAWLFENEPDAQGICWTCRQADEGRAALLFAPHVVALGHGSAGGRQGGVDVFVSCRGFVRRRRVSVPPIPGL